jgi:RNA polymerase sigma-70 factor (ECF subfamily)
MSNSQDPKLIERCQHGDRQALEQLVETYERPVYNAAYRFLGNPDDAADVTQVVFLKAFEHFDQYDPKFKFFSWIYRIAINESINHVKRNRKQLPLDERMASESDSPEDLAQSGDVSREIRNGLMALEEHYRAVVVLRHFSDCSYQQISEILQIPEKTVKSRLYSARQLMKDILSERALG